MTVQMGINTSNLFFAVELLVAELMFLWSAPKKKHFAVKFSSAVAFFMFMSVMLPVIRSEDALIYSLYSLVRFLLLFAFSFLAFYLSFDLRASMLFPLTAAGYAVQHLSYRVSQLALRTSLFVELPLEGAARGRLVEVIVMSVCYVFCYLVFGRIAWKNRFWEKSDRRFNAVSVLTIAITVGLSRLYTLFGEETLSETSIVYSIVACFLALYIQFALYRQTAAENERAMLVRVHAEEKKQYELVKNTIDSINIKVHDAKHKLSALNGRLPESEIKSLQHDMDIYDSIIKTENKGLDVLMTQKSLECQSAGIRLSFSGNVAVLDFMEDMDLFSLLGNAIDNAKEAAEKLSDPDKKLIDVSVEARGETVFIDVTNYFDGDLKLSSDLPVTSKTYEPGYHGYEMKSMRLIAEKYGGGLQISTHGDLFLLNVFMTAK